MKASDLFFAGVGLWLAWEIGKAAGRRYVQQNQNQQLQQTSGAVNHYDRILWQREPVNQMALPYSTCKKPISA
jgi:hypothetical protein